MDTPGCTTQHLSLAVFQKDMQGLPALPWQAGLGKGRDAGIVEGGETGVDNGTTIIIVPM